MGADSGERDGPETLVAILVAARRAGNRPLEREMRRRLRSRYGVRLRFAADSRRDRGQVTHADA